MTPEVALARVKLEVQPTVAPTLSDDELNGLLVVYALADAEGRAPTDVGWVGRWQLSEVIRRAWLLKAAKVVPEVTYQVDGATYNQSDMHKHCLEMAAKAGRTIGTISVGVS